MIIQNHKVGIAALFAALAAIVLVFAADRQGPQEAGWRDVNEEAAAWLASLQLPEASAGGAPAAGGVRASAPPGPDAAPHVSSPASTAGESPAPPPSASPPPPPDAAPPPDASGKIDINAATADQLVALPGIGNAKAQAIVAYREANGPFRSIEQIQDVKGIGPAIFRNIRDSIAAGP